MAASTELVVGGGESVRVEFRCWLMWAWGSREGGGGLRECWFERNQANLNLKFQTSNLEPRHLVYPNIGSRIGKVSDRLIWHVLWGPASAAHSLKSGSAVEMHEGQLVRVKNVYEYAVFSYFFISSLAELRRYLIGGFVFNALKHPCD